MYHDELIESESHLALLGAKLCIAGYPYRTPNQIRRELIRIRVRFNKKVEKGKFKTQWDLDSYAEYYHWVDESDDSDDFMPSSKALKSEGASKGKGKKVESSSKKKSVSSSKGKGTAASTDA